MSATASPPLDPAFGTHALPGWAEGLRRLAEAAPRRWMASGLRRLVLLGRRAPFDVAVFGDQRARLHPGDNRAEKRVFAGARFWDRAERARIAAAIAAHAGPGPFVFVDAGANVGLYTLSARADAARLGVPFAALAVEPDPVNRARLVANLTASGAAEVTVAPVALSDRAGTARFRSAGLGNRGEARLGAEGEIEVPLRPLLDVLRDAGIDRVDALKIDIEGHEVPVFEAFLRDAPPPLRPRLIVLETGRGDSPALALLTSAGYRLETRTGINGILVPGPGLIGES